jgi:hypothetical protein
MLTVGTNTVIGNDADAVQLLTVLVPVKTTVLFTAGLIIVVDPVPLVLHE